MGGGEGGEGRWRRLGGNVTSVVVRGRWEDGGLIKFPDVVRGVRSPQNKAKVDDNGKNKQAGTGGVLGELQPDSPRSSQRLASSSAPTSSSNSSRQGLKNDLRACVRSAVEGETGEWKERRSWERVKEWWIKDGAVKEATVNVKEDSGTSREGRVERGNAGDAVSSRLRDLAEANNDVKDWGMRARAAVLDVADNAAEAFGMERSKGRLREAWMKGWDMAFDGTGNGTMFEGMGGGRRKRMRG